jgi:hypothetical protein
MMHNLSSNLQKLIRRIIRPFMAERELAYYDRPHCRWPSPRKGEWSDHVICGEPPVDVVDVQNLQTLLKQIRSGNEALAEVLPGLLGATMDDTGGVPVCAAHKEMLFDEIAMIFSSATPQDQERLKEWLTDRNS